MKKVFIIAIVSMLLLMPAVRNYAETNTPCYDMWKACTKLHGVGDEGCEHTWGLCMDIMYGRDKGDNSGLT
ncbi:MAG: hypothetical protein GY765_15395 [bacterium]|nr:hypothetical protein [bacterium]